MSGRSLCKVGLGMPTTGKSGAVVRTEDHASALPWGSASTRRTRWPMSASACAKLTEIVVLPTPPFWLSTPMIMLSSLQKSANTLSRFCDARHPHCAAMRACKADLEKPNQTMFALYRKYDFAFIHISVYAECGERGSDDSLLAAP